MKDGTLSDGQAFSIIIPCFDSKQTIRQCLESVLREFGNGHQIIVVDDASRDDSCHVISEYPVHVVENTCTLGAGAARNRGIDHALHDWVLFVDSDVIIKEDTKRILQQAIRDAPDAMSFGSVSDIVPANPGLFQEFLACRAHFQYVNGPEYVTAFPSQLVMVRKAVFEKVGKFSERFVTAGGEEFEMGCRLSKYGIRTRILRHFQFYHVYVGFWKRSVKYFQRSKIFFRIFKAHGKFETVVASLMETIRSLYTFFGLIGFHS